MEGRCSRCGAWSERLGRYTDGWYCVTCAELLDLGELLGEDGENDGEKESACLVILHSSAKLARSDMKRLLHSSLIHETVGGVDDLHD